MWNVSIAGIADIRYPILYIRCEIPSECDLALGYLADVNEISLANEIYSSLAG